MADNEEMIWTVGLRDQSTESLDRIMKAAMRLQQQMKGAFDGFADWHDAMDKCLDEVAKRLNELGVEGETQAKILLKMEEGFGKFVNDVAPASTTLADFSKALSEAGVQGKGLVRVMAPLAEGLRAVWEPTDKTAEVFDRLKTRLTEIGVPLSMYRKEMVQLEQTMDAVQRSGDGEDKLLGGARSLFGLMGLKDEQLEQTVESLRELTAERRKTAEEAEKAAAQEAAAQAAQVVATRRMERQTVVSMSRIQNAVHLATSVASGNFYGLTRAITLCADKLKFIGLSSGIIAGIGAIGGAVAGAVTVFRKWSASAEEAKKKLDAVREADFNAYIRQMKDALRELGEEMTKTLGAIDKALGRDQKQLTLTRERIKAQIELNRQLALEGKDGEEAARINAEFDSSLRGVDRQAADADIALQIEAAQQKTDALRKLLEKYEGVERTFTTVVTNTGRTFRVGEGYDHQTLAEGEFIASAKGDKVREGGLVAALQSRFNDAAASETDAYGKILKKFVDERLLPHFQRIAALKNAPIPNTAEAKQGRDMALEQAQKELELARSDAYQRIPHSADFKAALREDEDYQRLRKRLDAIKAELEAAQSARDKVREALADAEDREGDLWDTKEIEERKADIAVMVEERKQERLQAVKDDAARREEQRIRAQSLSAQLAGLSSAGGEAQSRLAAAQSQVARAWGWYRDKDSLRSQIAEWDADAEARRQYAKDYHSLTRGRQSGRYGEALDLSRRGRYDELEDRIGEWRRKKVLSVDEEATMRVALAKDEEHRAQKALDEINEAAQRTADAIESIEAAIAEGGD